MKVRHFIALAGLSLVVVALVGNRHAQAGSQATQCADTNWPELQPSAPAYLDALELARTLRDKGFMVMCIAPSKWTGVFEGQRGAALYRTNQGSFDVLFLPKPQNFDRLEIVERHENGEYLYSFAGRPTPWPAKVIAGPRPTFFIRHTNRLIVAFDTEVADHLRTAFAPR
jgi:hypothetical protein